MTPEKYLLALSSIFLLVIAFTIYFYIDANRFKRKTERLYK